MLQLGLHLGLDYLPCGFVSSGGVLAASYLTGQFPAGADVAQSGTSDYLRLYLPSGVSHVFWAHAGTSTQPSLSGSPTYHQINVDGLEADAMTALFCQAIVNAGSPTPLWTISGYTQQLAPANTVAPTIDSATPATGDTIHCSTGTWSGTPTSYTYQWKRGGVNIGGATSSAYVVSGTNGDVLTCAVVATNSVGSSSAVTTSNSATITAAAGAPRTNLIREWVADNIVGSDGDAVASWTDTSATGDAAVQATGAAQPTLKKNILNGHAVVRGGGSKFLDATAVSESAATVFVVTNKTGGTSAWEVLGTTILADYWRYDGDGSGYIGVFRSARINGYPAVVPDTGVNIWAIVSSASTYRIWLNGVDQGAQSAAFSTGDHLTLFARPGGVLNFQGDIAEVLVYSGDRSAIVAAVNTYLTNKYNP